MRSTMISRSEPSSRQIGPDTDRAAQLASCYFVGCSVSILFVALRFWARWSIRGVGADDWCMLATWVVYLALTVVVGFLAFHGGTRHFAYLQQDMSNALYVLKLNWIAQPFGIVSLALGKIAIALLLVRLLDRLSFWRKWILYGTSVWTVLNAVLMCLFTFLQCKDPRALWDPEVKARTTCWKPSSQSDFEIYGASVFTLMDFLLALLPITLIFNLKMDIRKKVGVCCLLGCGSLTGIFAAIKTSKLVLLDSRSDLTWYTCDLGIWTGVEIALLVVCGSVPALKPLYDRFSKGSATASRPKSYSYDNSSRKPKKPFPHGSDDVDSDVFALTSMAGSGSVAAEQHGITQEHIRVTKTYVATWSDEGSQIV